MGLRLNTKAIFISVSKLKKIYIKLLSDLKVVTNQKLVSIVVQIKLVKNHD